MQLNLFIFLMHSGGLSNFLYYVSLPDLDDFDEQQLLEVEQQQQQQQQGNVNVSNGKHVIAESTFAKNSKLFGGADTSSPATKVATELAQTEVVGDDDDDAALSAKQANKRRRFDSDSGDSSLLRRLHTPRQEPREVGRVAHHAPQINNVVCRARSSYIYIYIVYLYHISNMLICLLCSTGSAAYLRTNPWRSCIGEHDY